MAVVWADRVGAVLEPILPGVWDEILHRPNRKDEWRRVREYLRFGLFLLEKFFRNVEIWGLLNHSVSLTVR